MRTQYVSGVVGYTRLSDEDGRTTESRSIETQREMINKSAKERGLSVDYIFVDDGYTGTNFNRPDYQKMREGIISGDIKCVIVKDLSRFGRNAALMTIELEHFNDDYGLRFISITEDIDTVSTNDYSEVFQIILVLNEMYPRDCSKKIKYSWKNGVSDGKFMFGTPPYGYVRGEENNLQLAVDPIAAVNVKRIFSMYSSGDSMRSIAEALNAEGIKSPRAYYYERKNKPNPHAESDSWNSNTVRVILENEAYRGVLIQGKRRTVSYKNKKRKLVPESEWYRCEDAHESIVDDFIWDMVQRRRKDAPMVRRRKNGSVGIFSGLLKCGECGSALAFTTANKRTPIYRCSHYNTNGMAACTPHRLYEQTLIDVFVEEFHQYTDLVKKDKDALYKMAWEKVQQSNRETSHELQARLRSVQNKIELNQAAMSSLIADRAQGLLPDKIYMAQTSRLSNELDDLEDEYRKLASKVVRKRNEDKCVKEWVDTVERHFNFKEIDRTIVTELVEDIIVHEVRTPDGQKNFSLIIKYRFVGTLDEVKKDIA